MSLLIDDLRNAAATAALLGSNTVQTLGRKLDLDDRPAAAIDARGAIVYVNTAFNLLLPLLGEDLMITADGRLRARDKASDAALRTALLLASGRRPGTRDVGTLAVQRPSGMAIVARTVPISAISANPFFDAKLLLIFAPAERRNRISQPTGSRTSSRLRRPRAGCCAPCIWERQ